MAQSNVVKKTSLYYVPKATRWSQGIGSELPEAYKKFWREWKIEKPTPVYYIPKEGRYEIKNGVILPVQNIPIPLKYPKELDEGIWGGEAVVQGFVKKNYRRRRVPRFWVPQLFKSVVHSEILNKYMRTIVTNRTLELIHKNYGFDHYLLKTKACDLRSVLALSLKREMLIQLWDKTLYPDDPAKRDEVYSTYEPYLANYTREEIEWYGLTWKAACDKLLKMKYAAYNPVPLKIKLREQLIKELQEEKFDDEEIYEKEDGSKKSWLSKLNPFGGRSNPTTA